MIQKRKPPWGMFFILLLLALAASYYIAGLFKLDDVTIQNLKLKSWQWRRIQMECLSSRIMRQTVIFPFWREKVMNMIRRRVMSTRIMDYDFSGTNSEIKTQEEKGDDLC